MKTKVTKGSLVIINTTDSPCLNCIAKVTSIKKGTVYAKYISKNMLKKYGNRYCWTSTGMATHIHDFGIEVLKINTEEKTITAKKINNSVATYEDGKPRDWQDERITMEYNPRVFMN
ncbi:MAG: hypothetical protein V4629_03320 [Pseudomonadota bacterium]